MLVSTSDLSDIVDYVEVVIYSLVTRVGDCLRRALYKNITGDGNALLLLIVVSLENIGGGR
jgi:hypothetical protein